MHSNLMDKLHFALEPVAIYFTNEKPEGALQFEEGKRGCVASMLVAAGRGKTAVFDENTYGCPGGGVGLCFGDTFTKHGHPTEYLLSTGDAGLAAAGKTTARSLGRGERFFNSPATAAKWRAAFPYAKAPQKYVVFMPLGQAEKTPDLVYIFANPDQLSALVTLAGFYNGERLNTLAPFTAACQSIALARQEAGKEHPMAILGFVDISQRHSLPKELLGFVVPYGMFCQMDGAVDESCLSTEAWEKIADRFK